MDENTVKRILPHNDKAEQGIIGSMLVNRDAISDVMDMLTGDEFYNKQYGILFDNMVELYSEGASVDTVTLNERLKRKAIPDEVANTDTLARLVMETPIYAPVKDYARIVKDKATLRQLIRLCENTEADGYKSEEAVEDILERAEQSIFKLVQNRNGSEENVSIRDVVMNVILEMEEAARHDGKVTGVPTGFRDLDSMLTGMHAGELLLVAARPAMGKTAFVLNIAHYLAVMKHIPVGFFSLEMSREQLASRVLAIDAMVDSKNMKTGNLSDDDWDKVIESTEAVANSPLYIEENSAITISDLRSVARKWKQNYGIQVLMIDYLQLMSPSRSVESRQVFIAEVSRALKNLAKELKIPIIALSQLSRAVDARPDHKPVLSDLRESGSIEQDADVVMFIYRDEYYNPETTEKPQTAEIIIAKQRSGETGSVDLRWIGKYTKFADPEKHYKG
ncbi:MAG: replicative DNA helicase [Wujia sp.]|nr:replicative DNA helicase [Wujia sp.]MCI6240451.1 replicative DNA helicase [Clostridium sp.]MDD7284341.1 replicative DNA helicase [Clostridium sp.]MDY3727192.1 replicative DNA helicase [Wujia sp.]